ncbi:LacI family DNA-binding transcriptional regulator [Paenibacillus thalictri]|uniref:LacI family DNA-binding transcriptional regulator n=1 Tax=Paenibacillus thalictri TaxID=2527873 RepID=UPI001F0E4387|nr:LacI family DNA-binding transcriptional regulator [Paenibacillus thalictri]
MANKRVTSFDVARKAGVSRSVVSAVLNDTPGIGVSAEKRKAVLEAIRELGYQVDAQARGMKTGRSQCLAAFGNVSNPLFLQVLEGMQETCSHKGYHVLLYGSGNPPQDQREELIELYMQRRIDGVVAFDRPQWDRDDWVRLVQSKAMPYVSVEGYPDEPRIASVLMDYREAARRALDFMWERTGLVPLYVEMNVGVPLGFGDIERRKAYEEWMLEKGWQPAVTEVPDKLWRQAEPKWLEWLKFKMNEGKPCAVFTNWSRAAVSISRAAFKLGYTVGEDVHIMAGDNTDRVNQHVYPSLTAVEVPYREMGRLAVERLAEYVEGRRPLDAHEDIVVPAELAVRESVGWIRR